MCKSISIISTIIRLRLRSLLRYVQWLWEMYIPTQNWLEKMKDAEIGKVYNHISLVFWSQFMFLVYCHSPWNQQSKKQHDLHYSFHNITRGVQRSTNMAKDTPHTSNITSITIHFLWTVMNFWVCSKGYQLHEFQVRISQITEKLEIKVMQRHETFERPVSPTHAQIGTLTASPIVPCSWSRLCINTPQI